MSGTECVARSARPVSAINSISLIRESRAHGTTASTSSHDDGEDDHLVKDAAKLVAAAHVADRHMVGIDHAGQFDARLRLAGLAQAAQSIMPIMRRGGVSSWTAFTEPHS